MVVFILFDGQWMSLMNEWFINDSIIYYFTWLKPIFKSGKIHLKLLEFILVTCLTLVLLFTKTIHFPFSFLRLNRGGPNSKCLARSGRSWRRMPCRRAGRGRAPRASSPGLFRLQQIPYAMAAAICWLLWLPHKLSWAKFFFSLLKNSFLNEALFI